MAENNVAIVPTLGIGSFLSMNFDGDQENDELQFFRSMLPKYVKPTIENEIIEELKSSYHAFYEFVFQKKRKPKNANDWQCL